MNAAGQGERAFPSSPRLVMASEDIFAFYLSTIVFLSFFTYSIHTPIGFISFEDVAIGVALMCYMLSYIRSGNTSLPDLKVAFLSLVTFFLIVFSTLIVNTGLDISPVIKYAIFLVAIPATFWLSGHCAPSPALYARALRNFAICGNLLLAYVAASLLIGHHSGAGENFAISMLGQPIFKNQIGEFLIFISSANFILYGMTRKPFHLVCYLASIACCLGLDVRGPILATLFISSIIYWKYFGLNFESILRLAGFAAVLLLVAWALYMSGLVDQQFNRLLNFADTSVSAHNISSSASRIILWKYAIGLITESPFFGIGYGGFFYDQSRDWLFGLREPHNNILQVLSEGGLVGFLAFAALLLSGFLPAATSRSQQAFKLIAAAYLLTTLVDIVWVRGTGHLFWIIFYLFALSPRAGTQTDPGRARLPMRAPAWR